MSDIVTRFSTLFQGLQGAFGKYIPEQSESFGMKVDGKAEFLKRLIIVEDWEDHLAGNAGLGIVPINKHNQVVFGAIDIDDYDIDLVSINNNVIKHGLPLVVCRTKSGGAHLYCFTTKWVNAKIMREKLRDMAAFLGFGTAEIFPKQIKIMIERGDMGSWINIPYFGGADTQRYAIRETGRPIKSVGEFIEYAESKRIDPRDLQKFELKAEDILQGGPPCLNRIFTQGGPSEGQRNKTLFNVGVYLSKAYNDDWEQMIDVWNQKFKDPLSSGEVEAIKQSLRRRKYNYQCSEPPLKTYCNSLKCRSCKYGVATGSDIPLLSALSIIKTDPPLFFIDVEEGDRIYLTSDQLQNPRLFQRACMEKLHKIPPVPKAEVWRDILVPLFETANIIEVPEEMTTSGQLIELLEDFCLSQVSGEEKDVLLQGKILNDEFFHYFRMRDFKDYLIRKKFDIKQHQITMIFREKNLEAHSFQVRGKCVRCWKVKKFIKPGKFTVPRSLRDEPY